MTTSTKTKAIISLFSLACMSGWASAAAVNQSLTVNNKFETSQNANTSSNEVKSDSDVSNQFQADNNSQADVADDSAELEADEAPLAASDDTEETEAPPSKMEPEESMDEVSEFANVTSDVSSTVDTNVSLVSQTLSRAEVGKALNSTVKQGLDTVIAADAAAQATQATQATEQLVNVAVQDTVSATTQTLVQQNVDAEVSELVSEQISTAVQAETATEITQTIAANMGL
jgi:hypothetical protein